MTFEEKNSIVESVVYGKTILRTQFDNTQFFDMVNNAVEGIKNPYAHEIIGMIEDKMRNMGWKSNSSGWFK